MAANDAGKLGWSWMLKEAGMLLQSSKSPWNSVTLATVFTFTFEVVQPELFLSSLRVWKTAFVECRSSPVAHLLPTLEKSFLGFSTLVSILFFFFNSSFFLVFS